MFQWLRNLVSRRSGDVTAGASSPTLASLFGVSTSAAGVQVTKTNALNCMGYWSGIRLLSESLAMLPLRLYRSNGYRQTPEEVTDHPALAVTDRPNPTTTPFNFFRTGMNHVLTRGNVYAEIVTDGAGRPAELWLADPDDVEPAWDVGGRSIRYGSKHNPKAPPIPQESMIHVPGLGFDGVRGYDVVTVAANTIGLAMGAEQYGANWFGSANRPGGVLQNASRLTPEAVERQRADWKRIHSPGSHEIAILQEGTTFTPFDHSPEKSQALDVRKFQLLEIARLLRIPPHLLYDLDRATFANIEQMSLEYIIFSLSPWLVAWEQEYSRKLLSEVDRRGGLYFRFDVTELLRGDPHNTASSESLLLNAGAKTPNEVRAVFDLPPMEHGDDLRMPLNSAVLGAQPAGGGDTNNGGSDGTAA